MIFFFLFLFLGMNGTQDISFKHPIFCFSSVPKLRLCRIQLKPFGRIDCCQALAPTTEGAVPRVVLTQETYSPQCMVNRVLWYRVNRIRLRSDSVIAPLYPAFRINESIASIFVQPENQDAPNPKCQSAKQKFGEVLAKKLYFTKFFFSFKVHKSSQPCQSLIQDHKISHTAREVVDLAEGRYKASTKNFE